MLTENKMKHILGVSRECYSIAKTKYNLSEDMCRKAFMLGYLHDVGYEFTDNANGHSSIGYELIESTFGISLTEIRDHGKLVKGGGTLLDILNEADLKINNLGENIGYEKRLSSIKERYGCNSVQYTNSVLIIEDLKSRGII